MKIIKNNIKLLIVIFISIIVTNGISVFATYNYFAKDVEYIKTDGIKINVEEALNELYTNRKTIVLLQSDLSSKNAQSVLATSIPNYQNLTEDNFLIVHKSMEWAVEGVENQAASDNISKTYNSSTGTLNLGRQWQNWPGDNGTAWTTYDVYCIY